MKLFGLYFSAVWILCCCYLVCGGGQGVCSKGKLVTRINLTTELHSEILLPCLFEQALTGSNLTMNPEAVWTQINETIDHIVEIKVNNPVNFWNSRNNRIKVSGAPATGNFSILIRDVQLSDQGLYRCELYRDNCSLGYKEIEISLAAVEFSLLNNWQLIVAGGGGFLLLFMITVCVYYTWTKHESDKSAMRPCQGVCSKGKLVTRINLTTELQSEILLPCLFEQALTGSNLTMNPEAVWTQINETIDHIVEIKVNNPVNFWNSRNNRIKVPRAAAASGNFSILIKDVQLSDLGLYRCELYRDINCSLGYKEIEISLAAVEFSLLNNWQLIVAGGGGGFLLLCLITVCVYYTWTKRKSYHSAMMLKQTV
ncbi:hypothetical protein cypCar_00015110 [Cyprinus carpio]|nr:hypothetical protein cypCar_00015110 [Cyprinus carpio]